MNSPNHIDWKETFLFFYWDIQRQRPTPKDMGIVNERIRRFFQVERPTSSQDRPCLTWDGRLFHLMRTLACYLGIDRSLASSGYAWLGLAPGDRRAPFVDWLFLEANTDLLDYVPRTSPSSHDAFAQSLHRLVVQVYGPTDRQRRWDGCGRDMLWSSNPFLVEFQQTHNMGPWEVCTTSAPASRLFLIQWPNRQTIGKKAGIPQDDAHLISFDFYLSPNGKATLIVPGQAMNNRIASLSKRYYTAVLRWAIRMRDTGDVKTSPCGLFEEQFQRWCDIGDDEDESMEVMKNLWSAVRDFGTQPVKTETLLRW